MDLGALRGLLGTEVALLPEADLPFHRDGLTN
jgi:hypothetical protein